MNKPYRAFVLVAAILFSAACGELEPEPDPPATLTPTGESVPTHEPTPTLTPTAKAVPTLEPTPTLTPTGEPEPTHEPTAAPMPTAKAVPTLEPTPTPTPIVEIGCLVQSQIYNDLVVDDETGKAISGAYWRSETLDGEVFLELEEDGDHERYDPGVHTGVINEKVKEAGKAADDLANTLFGRVSVDFRVVVAKRGYTTIGRILTAAGDRCGVSNVNGDLVFRLVKGPPGPDDIFRNPR